MTALEPFGLVPDLTLKEAAGAGRYALEQDERVDVLVPWQRTTLDGQVLLFDED